MAEDVDPRSVAFQAHSGAVHALALTASDTQIITAGDDGAVRIWERATAQRVGEALTDRTGSVRALALASGDTQIVAVGDDSLVRIWDLAAHRLVTEPLAGHRGAIWAVALAAGDTQIITGGGDGTVRLWDRAARRGLDPALTGHQSAVLAVAATRDGKEIVTGGRDGVIMLWDRLTRRPMGDPLADHSGAVHAVALTCDDAQIITAGEDGTVRVWDRVGRRGVGKPLTGHDGAVNAVALTCDDTQIITGGADGTVRIWDRITLRSVGEPLTGHTGAVHAVALTSDDTQIITGGADGTVRIWDRIVVDHDSIADQPAAARWHAAVASDIPSADDLLDLTQDVDTVAALLADKKVPRQLSIALLGAWGSGKSSFMHQVVDRVGELAKASAIDPRASAYASHIAQVQFNAWHYSDDQLWVGLVEHLFREIADDHPRPHTDSRESLQMERNDKQTRVEEIRKELKAVSDADAGRGWFRWLNYPSHAVKLLREAWREALSEFRSGKRVWAGLVFILLGAVAVVASAQFGQAIIGWFTGVAVGLLAPIGLAARELKRLTDKVKQELVDKKRQEAESYESEVRQLDNQLAVVDPAQRLEQLLAEISAPNRYERYRGLTGRVGDDLRRLSLDLAKARDEWERGGAGSRPPLQQIILYVDDLDRCPSHRVVETLQAVNLLLSLPALFTVVVAAEPQWLVQALEEHHSRLLGLEPRARSLEYLDKIFQVPFAIRPMGEHGSPYLRGLLPAVEENAPGQTTTERASEDDLASSSPNPDAAEVPATTAPRASTPEPTEAASRIPDLTGRALRLRPVERDFLPLLSPLLPTPRAVKRLTNLYRLLRIGVPARQLAAFIGTDKGGAYQAAALLLATVVGTPAEAVAFLTTLLETRADPHTDILGVLTELDERSRALGARVAERIELIDKTFPVHKVVTTYQSWAVPVARYSFETYPLFSGE